VKSPITGGIETTEGVAIAEVVLATVELLLVKLVLDRVVVRLCEDPVVLTDVVAEEVNVAFDVM
jgi:hypothetical protein